MEGERAEVERIKPKDLTTMTTLKYAGTAEVRGFVLKQQYISLGVRLFLQGLIHNSFEEEYKIKRYQMGYLDSPYQFINN